MMLLFPTRFLYPVSAVQLQEQHGILPAEFLGTLQVLRPFLEKETAYGVCCTAPAVSPKGRTLLLHYRKTYRPLEGCVIEILDAEVVRPLAQAA